MSAEKKVLLLQQAIALTDELIVLRKEIKRDEALLSRKKVVAAGKDLKQAQLLRQIYGLEVST